MCSLHEPARMELLDISAEIYQAPGMLELAMQENL